MNEFEQVLCMTEYEEICDSFEEISDLLVDLFSIREESPMNELVDETSMSTPIRKRLKESREADEIILKIKRILTIDEPDRPSLKSRIRNYTNAYIGRLINIEIANPRTQSLIGSLHNAFHSYRMYKNNFSNNDEDVFVNNLLASLKNEATILNNFLFDHLDLEGQRTPLFTIFSDRTAVHLNIGILTDDVEI
jgi:hypothetical protein